MFGFVGFEVEPLEVEGDVPTAELPVGGSLNLIL